MIIIHWDFETGEELSYISGMIKGDNFVTHCLEFFTMDTTADDVLVLRKDGKRISLRNIQEHTSKEIRKEHNICKILIAGGFNWL